MPVRSSNSPVLRWPDAATVQAASRRWAQAIAGEHPEILRVGYFGSYARGDWGVGSDLDVVIIVAESELPLEERARQLDSTSLPVPADLLVYTASEWDAMLRRGDRFARMIGQEPIWVFERG